MVLLLGAVSCYFNSYGPSSTLLSPAFSAVDGEFASEFSMASGVLRRQSYRLVMALLVPGELWSASPSTSLGLCLGRDEA